MEKQCHNPYLPLYEHIPDGEPHVFDNRLYVFGSHDMENGNEFCELDYVAWSAAIDNLSEWKYEGVIFQKNQDPYNTENLPLYAPDVVKGPDGRYYLFYCIKFQDSINVAVCDSPAGQYEFYGRVHYPDGTLMTDGQPYDPALVCCEEGNFLYFGFAPCMINIPRYKNQDLRGGSVLQLEDDMLTVKKGLLKGFTRIHLHPGEEKIVYLECPLAELRYYDETQDKMILEAGIYHVYVEGRRGEVLI
jgi:hypothetical protein